jgi:hypothetical protein
MSQPPFQFPHDQRLDMTLEAQEWNIVFAALNELPMRVARPVFDKLMAQVPRNHVMMMATGDDADVSR